MRTLSVAAGLLMLTSIAGCATGGGGKSLPSDPNKITWEELDDPVIAKMSAFEAIRQLRPLWLRAHRDPLTTQLAIPKAYLDGTLLEPAGEAPESAGESSTVPETIRNVLLRVSMARVKRIEFMDPGDARIRYGDDHGGGAILIFTSGEGGWD